MTFLPSTPAARASFSSDPSISSVLQSAGDLTSAHRPPSTFRRIAEPSFTHVASAADVWLAHGPNPVTERLRARLRRMGPHFRSALIQAEPGGGAMAIAQSLHSHSGADGNFESLRLGDSAYARDQQGPRLPGDGDPAQPAFLNRLFRRAAGGTLFIEDVAHLDQKSQSLLVRQINESVGSARRTRVVLATARPVPGLIASGRLLRELHIRVAAFEIVLLPLDERLDDLIATAEELLQIRASLGANRLRTLSDQAGLSLEQHPWTGGLPELEAVLFAAVERAERAGRAHPDALLASDLELTKATSVERSSPDTLASRTKPLQDVIDEHVLGVLDACAGNKFRTAEVLGISRSTLYRMLDARLGSYAA